MPRKKQPTSRLREINSELYDKVREALADNPALFAELDTALLDADTDQSGECYRHTEFASNEARAHCLAILWPLLTDERDVSAKELREVARKMENRTQFASFEVPQTDTLDTTMRDMVLSDLRKRMNAARRFQRFAHKQSTDKAFSDISSTIIGLTGDTSFLLAKSGGWVAFLTHGKADSRVDSAPLVETTCGPGLLCLSNEQLIPFTIVPLHKLDTLRLRELSKTLPF